jgi:hypothetical protein
MVDGESVEREVRLPAAAATTSSVVGYHEMANLDRRRRYRFCVSAHTKMGQSDMVCSAPVSSSSKGEVQDAVCPTRD